MHIIQFKKATIKVEIPLKKVIKNRAKKVVVVIDITDTKKKTSVKKTK